MIRTTEGREVRLRPVSRVLIQSVQGTVERELRAAGLPLNPPTYTVTTDTGDTETHVHDEHSLTTDEERAAWTAYQAVQERRTAETNARVSKALLVAGVVVEAPPEDWAEEMRYLGVELPDEPRDLRYSYLELEVLKTPADIMNAIGGIMRLSMDGAPQEALDAVDALFRRALEGDATLALIPTPGGMEL